MNMNEIRRDVGGRRRLARYSDATETSEKLARLNFQPDISM